MFKSRRLQTGARVDSVTLKSYKAKKRHTVVIINNITTHAV